LLLLAFGGQPVLLACQLLLPDAELYAPGFKVTQFGVQAIEEAELAEAGFSARIFRNLNTKEELEAAASGEVARG